MPAHISVVISNYNYLAFLPAAINAALNQTRAPDQVVVVDDGSQDGSAEWLRERYAADDRFTLILRENGGQLSAMVEGVRHCRGEILCFLDADDVWPIDYLEAVARAFDSAARPDFVFAQLRYEGQRQGLYHSRTRDYDFGLTPLLTLASMPYIGSPTSALSVRRPLATQICDIPPKYFPEWRSQADDWLVYGSALLGARKYFLAEPAVTYRVHGGNAYIAMARQTAASESLRYSLRKHAMLRHYRELAGLDGGALRYAKYEFKTKPEPDFAALRSYCRLVFQSDLALGKKLEQCSSMLGYYLSRRSGASR